MSFAVKKSLGLGADASEAEVLAKFAEIQKSAALGKLTAKQKRYAKAMLGDEALLKFATLTPAEKVKVMKAKPMPNDEADDMDDEDEEEEDGDSEADKAKKAVLRKAKKAPKAKEMDDDEDETPEGQKKARLHALAKSNPEVAELIRKSDIDAIEKSVGAKLAYLGKSRETAELLYDLQMKAGRSLAEKVQDLLTRAGNAVAKGGIFKEYGSERASTGTTAADELKAIGAEIQKKDSTLKGDAGRAVAMTKARQQNPELAEREKSERQSAN